jgi:signal transduction histidine kinase
MPAPVAPARQRGALSEFRRGAEAGDPEDLLARLLLGPDGLAPASRADGAAWVGPERVIAVGLTPDLQSLRSLTLQAGEGGEPHASLRLDLPAPRDPRRARPAGMLAMRVGDGCLALFRRELVQEINWGGDPAKAAEIGPDGRLSPRRSFALWREEVRGACRPWDNGEDALLRMAAGLLAAVPIHRLEARALARVAAMVGRTRRGSASLADLLTPQATAILLSGEGPDATVIDVTPGLCALLDTSPAPLHGLALWEAESLLGLRPYGGKRDGEAGGPGLYAFHSPDHGQLTLRLDIEPVLQVAAPEATHHCEVLFVDDETRQSRLSAALRSTELHVERARRARDAFLGTTSHELRTPLNAIIGLADLLTEPDLQLAEIHRYASEIGRAGRSMLALVENLLSVARLGTGRFEARPERLDLADLLRRQAALLEALFEAKTVRLRVDLIRAVPVVTDSSLVGPAVLNLLANALKFTPPGGEVLIELSSATGVAEIAITDTGPGIPKADRVRIFEAFEQGDESVLRRHGGAGLGLFIARNMVAAVGGSLSLRSGRRRGSCFVVRLPSLPDPGGDGVLPN